MSDLHAMLGDRYEALASAISATASDWLGHDTPHSPHGWRCEDKTRYPGPCGCDGQMADEVMGVLEAILPGLLAQAWDEGRTAGCADPYKRYGECGCGPNPYRREADRGVGTCRSGAARQP